MRFATTLACTIFLLTVVIQSQSATAPKNCPPIDQSGDDAFHRWSQPAPKSCHTAEHDGYLIDPSAYRVALYQPRIVPLQQFSHHTVVVFGDAAAN
jgi:hypothetical protein